MGYSEHFSIIVPMMRMTKSFISGYIIIFYAYRNIIFINNIPGIITQLGDRILFVYSLILLATKIHRL